MPKTEVRSGQIKDSTVGRADLDTITPGTAVVAKIVAGAGIALSSTGADTGTGDVTISQSGAAGDEVFIGPNDPWTPGTPYELWWDTDEPALPGGGGGGGSSGPHAASHQPGGADALTDLSAAILTSGQLPDARLSGNVVLTTDPRLSDARTPTTHVHAQADITNLVSDLAAKEVKTAKNAASGYAGLDASSKLTGSQQVYGTAANTACVGNDARLSDARTPTTHSHAQADVTNLVSDLAAKAPLASPALTGTPTAPTAAAATNNTQIATTAYVKSQVRTGVIGFVIDDGGGVIAAGVKGSIEVPFTCTITGVTILATDAGFTAGSIVVDIWKDTYANYPPSVADTIVASAKPTLSSANKNKDTTLTGWNKTINAGDVLTFKVDSATVVTRVLVSLTVQAS